MRHKTSVTLPVDLPAEIDRFDGDGSPFPARTARQNSSHGSRAKRDARDAKIIDRNAGRLNAEAVDVLEYQEWFWMGRPGIDC